MVAKSTATRVIRQGRRARSDNPRTSDAGSTEGDSRTLSRASGFSESATSFSANVTAPRSAFGEAHADHNPACSRFDGQARRRSSDAALRTAPCGLDLADPTEVW